MWTLDEVSIIKRKNKIENQLRRERNKYFFKAPVTMAEKNLFIMKISIYSDGFLLMLPLGKLWRWGEVSFRYLMPIYFHLTAFDRVRESQPWAYNDAMFYIWGQSLPSTWVVPYIECNTSHVARELMDREAAGRGQLVHD